MGRESSALAGGEHDTGKRLTPLLKDEREALHGFMEQAFEDKNAEDDVRYEQLRVWLDADDYILPNRELIECYFDWKASNRVVWPLAGGRLDQPVWVLETWRTLERLDEFYKLKVKVIKPVSIAETMP